MAQKILFSKDVLQFLDINILLNLSMDKALVELSQTNNELKRSVLIHIDLADKYLSKSYRVFCAEFSQYRQDLHLHSFVAVVGLQRQPFIFDFSPKYFDRVELRAVGWQKM